MCAVDSERGSHELPLRLRAQNLDVAVDDNQVDKVVEVITNAAKTGQIGDGKIFVTSIDSAVRIRTGETDADAL